MSNIIQSQTGDCYRFRYDTDPRGMGGVWVEKWMKRDGEPDHLVMDRATKDEDPSDYMAIPPDVCHKLADSLARLLAERYVDSR